MVNVLPLVAPMPRCLYALFIENGQSYKYGCPQPLQERERVDKISSLLQSFCKIG
jgi:hypothetical protein